MGCAPHVPNHPSHPQTFNPPRPARHHAAEGSIIGRSTRGRAEPPGPELFAAFLNEISGGNPL